MSLVPIIRATQMISVLLKAGFVIVRQNGSHVRFKNYQTGKATTVSLHAKDLTRKMIMTILKQAGISVETFLKLK